MIRGDRQAELGRRPAGPLREGTVDRALLVADRSRQLAERARRDHGLELQARLLVHERPHPLDRELLASGVVGPATQSGHSGGGESREHQDHAGERPGRQTPASASTQRDQGLSRRRPFA